VIREELQASARPIDSIKPHPKNVRQGDIGAIAQSLEAHGQYVPVVVQKKTKHIVKGNHTWRAAKQLGWETVAVLELDLTDRQALDLLLTDNKTSDQALYDDSALADLLQDLAKSKQGLENTGYTGDDLDDLLASFQERFQPSKTPVTMPNPETGLTTASAGLEKQSSRYFDQDLTPTTIRGIVLDYPLRDFTWAVAAFAKLRDEYNVTSNAEVVIKLLSEATGEPRP
jgi:hypothetical protein